MEKDKKLGRKEREVLGHLAISDLGLIVRKSRSVNVAVLCVKVHFARLGGYTSHKLAQDKPSAS